MTSNTYFIMFLIMIFCFGITRNIYKNVQTFQKTGKIQVNSKNSRKCKEKLKKTLKLFTFPMSKLKAAKSY